ncbi:MAG: hypothetical protein GY751_17430 [Bacteroidetes bacterium]|nr:hypothetical protein [Bacteroidota bacterium]
MLRELKYSFGLIVPVVVFVSLMFDSLWSYFALAFAFGLAFIITSVFGFLLLETVNYIEHYGLERDMIQDGVYEKTKPRHSWNCNNPLGWLPGNDACLPYPPFGSGSYIGRSTAISARKWRYQWPPDC